MKKNILLLISTLVAIYGFGQTACSKYGGNYNQILSELNNRNTRTDRHRLNDEHLKSIAKYWVAVCKCENGVTSETEADALDNTIFENKSHFTDQFLDRGKVTKKDKTPFGDLYPSNKIYTKSSCLKGTSSLISESDCNLGSYTAGQDHKESYRLDFINKKCICENQGVSNKADEKQLLAMMKYNRDNYVKFGGNATKLTIPTSCKTRLSGNNNNFSGTNINLQKGIVLKDEYIELLDLLGQSSDNPEFNEMVNKIKENSDTYSKLKDVSQLFGQNQDMIDFYNMTENISQAIAVGTFVASWFKPEIEKLSSDQQNALDYIKSLSFELRKSFDEAKSVPTYFVFNQQTIDELNELESNISKYQKSTLLLRSLFWIYQVQPGYLTTHELDEIKTELESKTIAELYEIINKKSNLISNSTAFPHMLNTSGELNISLNKILFAKSKSYKNIGNEDIANDILNNIKVDNSPNNAIKGLVQAINNNDYNTCIKFYEPLKNHFYTKGWIRIIYPDLLQLNFDSKGLSRTDATLLMCYGVISYMNLGQISQAKEEIKALDFFDKQMFDWVESNKLLKQGKKSVSDEKLYEHYQSSHALILATKANLENKLGNFDSALQLINTAIELDKDSGTLGNLLNPYLGIKLHIKFKILINQKKYPEAKTTERELKNLISSTAYTQKQFYLDELRFDSAILALKEKKYQKGLMILEILIKTNNKRPKYYALQTEIYKEIGQIDNQKKSQIMYNKLITQNK